MLKFNKDEILAQKAKLSKEIMEQGVVVLATIVDGHHGVHTSRIFLELMGEKIPKEEEELVFASDEAIEKATDALQELMGDDAYYIGFNETDGSIDLFFGEEKPEITQEDVLSLIAPLYSEWKNGEDWWHYSRDSQFANLPNGFDINVYLCERNTLFSFTVYKIKPAKDFGGLLDFVDKDGDIIFDTLIDKGVFSFSLSLSEAEEIYKGMNEDDVAEAGEVEWEGGSYAVVEK